jgi:hypothetical protein
VNEEYKIDNQMEGIDKGGWEMLQQDLNFTCTFDDFVAVDDDVLPCGLISLTICSKTSVWNSYQERLEMDTEVCRS